MNSELRRPDYVLALAVLGLVLLLAASFAGILLDDGGSPETIISVRGAPIEIYGGEGLYRYDTLAKAVLFRGFDWANLFVCVPLIVAGVILRQRGRLPGRLLVAAAFGYMVYNYLIGVMGNAFNELFLVWTALFSVGLFGLVASLSEVDIAAVPGAVKAGFPRRSLSVYMSVLGVFLLVEYLSEIVTAYWSGTPPPSLGNYTTLELAALELGIMIPLHFIGAVLLWERRPAGYLLGMILLFIALMTFVSLSVAALMSYFIYGMGTALDVIVPAVLMVVTLGFTLAVARQLDDQSTSVSRPTSASRT